MSERAGLLRMIKRMQSFMCMEASFGRVDADWVKSRHVTGQTLPNQQTVLTPQNPRAVAEELYSHRAVHHNT
jgi:hypothetical protein